MARCASCGRGLTQDEATFLDGRFCEPCTEAHKAYDALTDAWRSIHLAWRVLRESGNE